MPKTTEIATTNALAGLDASLLAKLGDLANQYNEGAVSRNNSIPRLKVQTSPEAETKRGTVVLGQRIENAEVIDEGIPVDTIILLAMRDRYSYFNFNDKERAKETACRSRMFVRHPNMEPITGNNYGYACGNGCKFRNKELQTRCAAQHVIFALAVYKDAEGNRVEQPCTMILKGDNYFPIVEFLKKAVYVEVGGKQIKMPIFGFEVKLTTEKKVNGQVVYYVINYERGDIIVGDRERFAAVKIQADEAIKAIDAMNESYARDMGNSDDDDEPMPAKERVIDVAPKAVKTASVPWDEADGGGDVTDIEAMLSAELGK